MWTCERTRFARVCPWKLILSASLAAVPAAGPAQPSEDSGFHFKMRLNVPVRLRDGVHLSATIYLPPDERPAPVIFVVTPYGADRWQSWGSHFARNGYAFASFDARGRGNSEGRFEPWVNEGEDGADLVRWLAEQPFSDGRVAGWGGSYSGKNQWALALLAGPALKTIVPSASGYVGYDMGMLRNIPFPGMLRWLSYVSGRSVNTNLNRDDAYWVAAYLELSRGRIPYREFDRLAGNPSPIWQQWVAHPEPGTFWSRGTPTARELASVQIPVLAVTGLYDDAQLGTLRYWQEHQGRGEPKATSYLVIGPWDHPGTREPQQALGGLDFGEGSVIDMKRLNVEWYDWVLKGRRRPAILKDHVTYYIAGSNRWASAPTLQAATGHHRTLFLSSIATNASSAARRGALAAKPPPRDSDSYADDPAKVFNEGPEGGAMVAANFLTDRRIIDRIDGDGLIYDSQPFASDSDLVGRPRVRLFASMDVPDADFRVQLYEVRPDGSVVFLAQDQLRARYRYGPEKPQPVKAGRLERYDFDHFPFIARTIRKGSVIRLLICPLGASIHHQRNRHSGGTIASETAKGNRVAQVAVALGPGGSRVDLPFGREAGGPESPLPGPPALQRAR